MVVMFDIDGVLANFCAGLARLVYDTYGIHLPDHPQKVLSWDYDRIMLTPQQYQHVWKTINTSPDFWYRLPSLLTAYEWQHLANLCQRHSVYFVTARTGRHLEHQTQCWFEQAGILRANVIISKHKGEIAKAINAAYSLDDKAGNAVMISWMAPKCRSYLINRQYNDIDPEVIGSKVHRVETVLDFLRRTNDATRI